MLLSATTYPTSRDWKTVHRKINNGRQKVRRRWLLLVFLGILITLASTFIAPRTADARYEDIMGCENKCTVVATGWPLVFVRDYLGMSVGNRADILDVWLGNDRLDPLPFASNVIFWTLLLMLLAKALAWMRHGART